MSSPASPETRLLSLWRRLSPRPGGAWAFSRLLRRMVPYSGSIHPSVLALEPGHAVVELRDRRAVRNHLGSVHAIALANLGELASGLAMTSAMSPSVRAIVTRLEIQYHKKARGTLIAEGRADPPKTVSEPLDLNVVAEIKDEAGDVVSTVTVLWRLAPRPQPDERSVEVGAAPPA